MDLSAWSTCLLNFHRSHPSITDPLPAPTSVLSEHIYISPGCLTACLFLCLTCKLLCCLRLFSLVCSLPNTWTHLLFTYSDLPTLQYYHTCFFFFSSSEQIKAFEMMPPRSFLNGPEPAPVSNLSIHFNYYYYYFLP